MCDLAVFVNRHTLPSRTVTDDRHREVRATLNAPIRIRRPRRVARNAMEVEPMCIVENETVSSTIFWRYRQWTQELDAGRVPEGLQAVLEEFGTLKQEQSSNN
ncbi:hypothetical protein ALC62_09663 [Cyphomyrmex costatus]|uniref:Uncharacterized protein n=1 Tax=Cyphomyrmex costatus TaxID=456900 RepID=A0A151IFF1_9HYME|nr:hypothetical protein ALC62_09663 [Cyphomyrmex costatus]